MVAGIRADARRRRRNVTCQFEADVVVHRMVRKVTAFAHVDGDGIQPWLQDARGKGEALVGERGINTFANACVALTVADGISG